VSKETKFNQSEIMKVVRIHNYGGPEVLQYEEAPLPRPQAGEIRLLVHAAGVNPFDWKVRSGYLKDYIPHTFPLILGWDVSGVVDEAGPGVSRFKKGDEVFCMADATRDGAYAEYIVVPEAAVALKAKSQHHANAAAMPVGALTAWQAIFDEGRLQGGQRILIHGGAARVLRFQR
jgi:NADPH:quinone reductase-like Zn-dependent oxidoreductase